MKARQTAFKVWVNDLSSGQYIEDNSEFGSNYILIKDNKVSRVNILARVVQKYVSDDKNYVSIMLDDGFGTIRVKSWREDTNLIINFEVGNVVLVVGRVRKYSNEVYLTPEIARMVDQNWVSVRRTELISMYGEPQISTMQEVKEENVKIMAEKVVDTETDRQKILNLIDNNEDGIGVDDIINKSGLNNAKSIVYDLLREGEIFELKGKLKTIS